MGEQSDIMYIEQHAEVIDGILSTLKLAITFEILYISCFFLSFMYLLFFGNAFLLLRNFSILEHIFFGKKPSLRSKPLLRLGKFKQRALSSESEEDVSIADYGSFIGKSKVRRAYMKK